MDSGAWAGQRYNIRQRVIDQLDMTHKISVSGVYNAGGTGAHLLANANRIVDAPLAGGNSVVHIPRYTYITGMPVNIGVVYVNSPPKVSLQKEDPIYTLAFAPCTNQWAEPQHRIHGYPFETRPAV